MALEQTDLDEIRAEVDEALDDANLSDLRELGFQVEEMRRDIAWLVRYVHKLGQIFEAAKP